MVGEYAPEAVEAVPIAHCLQADAPADAVSGFHVPDGQFMHPDESLDFAAPDP